MPESVVRWPKDDQSSITVRPSAPRSAMTYQARPSIIDGDDRHKMREQRAGRIELAPGDDDMIALVLEFGLELGRALGAELGKGVTEARSLQDFREQQLLLRFVGDSSNGGDDADMVLRDLPDRGIRGRDDLDDLRNRRIGKLRPSEGFGTLSDHKPLCENRSSSRTGHSRSRSRIEERSAKSVASFSATSIASSVAANDMGGVLSAARPAEPASGI